MSGYGAVLGIDVGFSPREPTTCFCGLAWGPREILLRFASCRAHRGERRRALLRAIGPCDRLEAVALDGPLTKGLRLVPHYRSAEALLSRGVFQKRGKPGATSSPAGQELHRHATRLAGLVLECEEEGAFDLSAASHDMPIHEKAVVEAFPNQFLAALVAEGEFPELKRDASDRFWEISLRKGRLAKLVDRLLPGRTTDRPLEEITDHDERGAFACALTALCIARGRFVGVGDPDDGAIFLPPREAWAMAAESESWLTRALDAGLRSVQSTARRHHENHTRAQVIVVD